MNSTQQASSTMISIVRSLSSIEEEVRSEGIKLARASDGRLSGDCPWCDGELWVIPARGLFCCTGCHQAGDVIRWVQLTRAVAFLTAVDLLALTVMHKIDEGRVIIA
jgi:hypothetical protein